MEETDPKKCRHCGRKFNKPCHAREHEKAHDENPERVFCSVTGCDLSFSKNSNWVKHFNKAHKTLNIQHYESLVEVKRIVPVDQGNENRINIISDIRIRKPDEEEEISPPILVECILDEITEQSTVHSDLLADTDQFDPLEVPIESYIAPNPGAPTISKQRTTSASGKRQIHEDKPRKQVKSTQNANESTVAPVAAPTSDVPAATNQLQTSSDC